MKNSKFSLVLRMCRENAGLTQKQVADALNIERSTYAYYETGSSHPSGVMIVRLSKIFQVDYSLFMDAVADTQFDLSPENEEFTTLRDDSHEQREKLYSLKKKEQTMVILYRSFSKEQRDEVDALFAKFQDENMQRDKKSGSKDAEKS